MLLVNVTAKGIACLSCFQKAVLTLAALECMLTDEGFMHRCIDFSNNQMNFLLRLVNPNQ